MRSAQCHLTVGAPRPHPWGPPAPEPACRPLTLCTTGKGGERPEKSVHTTGSPDCDLTVTCGGTRTPSQPLRVRRRRSDSRCPPQHLLSPCRALRGAALRQAPAPGGPLAWGRSAADGRLEHIWWQSQGREFGRAGPAGHHRGRPFVRACLAGRSRGDSRGSGRHRAQGRPDSHSPDLRGEPAAHFHREGHWLQGVRPRGRLTWKQW